MKRLTVQELTGIKGLSLEQAAFAIEYAKDFDARRAATVVGKKPEHGYQLIHKEPVRQAVDMIIQSRLDRSAIDAEWVLMEAVDNHMIARQTGNLSASNVALGIVARHAAVDAFAAEKVNVQTDELVRERLLRGRKRASQREVPQEPDENPTPGEVSFL